jgi:hypothetical protein
MGLATKGGGSHPHQKHSKGSATSAAETIQAYEKNFKFVIDELSNRAKKEEKQNLVGKGKGE